MSPLYESSLVSTMQSNTLLEPSSSQNPNLEKADKEKL